MSEFTNNQPVFNFVDGITYRVDRPIVWAIGNPNGPTYTVEAGFHFDVSIPHWFRWLFSPHDSTYFKAAALHDHMLISGWDRITAGSQFHQALKADKVSSWRCLCMWIAVSLWKYR
jgi:hypothetical protein